MMTKDKNALNDCVDEIEATASKCGVEILQGDEDTWGQDKDDFYRKEL